MISKTKNIVIKIIFLIVLSMNVFSLSKADYKAFLDELKLINIDINTLIDGETLSRYDLAKLLNAVECKDCINPDSDFLIKYNSDFWSNFKLIAGNNFNDISYLWWIWDKKNYYYCVAYAGENEYMNWYPLNTSPVCAGNFCWEQKVSKSEFMQVIINLISNYIYNNLSVNRDNIQSWVNNLDKNSYQYKTLNNIDIKLIDENSKECSNNCTLKSWSEVKTYLKYCMFNLSECNMTPIWKLTQWYRPVAELNLLKNQKIIDIDQDYWSDIWWSANVEKILDILYRMNTKIDCTFNDDYDCDGILNSKDICPTTYNPSQNDFDKDGIWDVCDDDIDNDGIKNPIGIVDESWKINIRLWNQNIDNCLFVKNIDQKDTNKNWIWDACEDMANDNLSLYIFVETFTWTAPLDVSFKAITNWKYKKVSWIFSDWYTNDWETISHKFIKPGTYTIKAFAKWENNDAYASTTIIVWENPDKITWISATSSKLWWKTQVESNLWTNYIWKYDRVSWDFGDTEIIENQDRNFKKVFTEEWLQTIVIKAMKDNAIKWISQFNIWVWTKYPWSILRTSDFNPQLWEKISINTDYANFSSNDISYIERNRWDSNLEKNINLVASHVYKIPWQKVIIQKIVLKNWIIMTNMITIYVFDKTLFNSKWITVLPSSLINSVGQKIWFNVKTIWGKLESYINILFQHIPGISELILGNNTKKYFDYSFMDWWIMYPSVKININQCEYLKSDMTLYVGWGDFCLQEKMNGNLWKYKCDMDKDGIPDICDDDIDWDGVKNLLGIINYENNNCKISFSDFDDKELLNQISTENFTKHFKWICSLDNAPFIPNSNQEDINLNGVWDVMEKQLSWNEEKITMFIWDSDGDWIPDYKDKCMYIQETYNGIEDDDWCPEIWADLGCNKISSCGNWKIDPNESCDNCPIDIWICELTEPIVSCGNWRSDPGETCISCPNDVWTCDEEIKISLWECLQCPCPYTDSDGDIKNWNKVRSTLWSDKMIIPYVNSASWLLDF